jgi:hypothetical protein
MDSKECERMTYLLALAPTHVRWLGAGVVNVGPNVREVGLRRRLRLLDGLVDGCLRLLVDDLHVGVSMIQEDRDRRNKP